MSSPLARISLDVIGADTSEVASNSLVVSGLVVSGGVRILNF